MPSSTFSSLRGLSYVDRIRSSAGILSRGLDHRSELAALEIGEARRRAATFLLLFAAGALVGLFAGFAFNLLVVAIWWDSPHRVLSVGLLLAAELAVSLTLILRGRLLAARWRPLRTTIEQLKKDCRCLRELFDGKTNS